MDIETLGFIVGIIGAVMGLIQVMKDLADALRQKVAPGAVSSPSSLPGPSPAAPDGGDEQGAPASGPKE